MSSNLLLVIGPVIGLLAARLFGPWRPLTAVVAAAVGQLGLFWATMLWAQHRAMRILAAPPAGRDMMLVARAPHPPLGGRVLAVGVLVLIAGVVAMLVVGAQFLVMRKPGNPPVAD